MTFDGELTGARVESTGRLRDYPAILRSLDEVVAAKIFEPAKLQELSYVAFRSRLGEIAETAQDDLDFLFGFHWSWNNDPFSHFQLKRSMRRSMSVTFCRSAGMTIMTHCRRRNRFSKQSPGRGGRSFLSGEMLSQSMFNLPDGYSLSLRVADYYSLAHGRIEGAGVPVGIETKDAMAQALKIISAH